MNARGFTLVEVLVALVIVAVGMAAVLGALTSAADTTAYLREKSFAEWVGMNRIAELRLQMQRPSTGKASGETELAGRRWAWEQEIVKLDVPGMQRIDVRVRPAEGQNRKDAWVVTVTGIMGDAVAPPDGRVLDWWGSTPAPGPQPGGDTTGPAPEKDPEPGEPNTRGTQAESQ